MTLQEVQTFAEYSFAASFAGGLAGAVAVEAMYFIVHAVRDMFRGKA